MNPEVADLLEGYPPNARRRLLALRKLILETAAKTEGVGPIEEALKWGEPAYLPSKAKTGTTIRIDWKPSAPDECSMYFHCQTTLVSDFRTWFPDELECDGNRRIVLRNDAPLPKRPLMRCIAAAFTYHRDKRSRR